MLIKATEGFSQITITVRNAGTRIHREIPGKAGRVAFSVDEDGITRVYQDGHLVEVYLTENIDEIETTDTPYAIPMRDSVELTRFDDSHSLVVIIFRDGSREFVVCGNYDQSRPMGDRWDYGHYFDELDDALNFANDRYLHPYD